MTNTDQSYPFMPAVGAQFDQPHLYVNLRKRRIFAFLIDAVIVTVTMAVAAAVIAVIGIVTFGLGWLLYLVLWPGVALLYVAFTLGGRSSATVGMGAMGLVLLRVDGRGMDPLLAVVHAIAFWAGNAVLTPLVLLVSLFNPHKRLLHDIVLGTVMVDRRTALATLAHRGPAAPP